MCLFRILRKTLILTAVVCVILMFVPGLPPFEAEFESINFEEPLSFEGALEPNQKLSEAEILHFSAESSTLGFLKGAESFAEKDGYLYTGVYGGDILRIDLVRDNLKSQFWQKVARIGGHPCRRHEDERTCGRPLGMAFDQSGSLIVCDAYYGLTKVDVVTGKSQVIVPSSQLILGERNLITNSVAVSKETGDNNNNIMYFTTSSTWFDLKDGFYEILGKGSGRLLKYDEAHNVTEVLMDGINFANGVALSPEEDFLIVSELGRNRLWKYELKGTRKGHKSIFAILPGGGDNIKSNGKDGYLVGVCVPYRDSDKLFAKIRQYAPITRLVARALWVFQGVAAFLLNNHIVRINFLETVSNSLVFAATYLVRDKYGLVVELDREGKIVRSWHSPDGSVSGLSEAYPYGGYLYLGSPWNMYVARTAAN